MKKSSGTVAGILCIIFAFIISASAETAKQVVIASTANSSHASRSKRAKSRLKRSRPRKRRARRRHVVRRSALRRHSLGDPTVGDNSSGEDPVVRQAAVDAMGNLMGSFVAVDPHTGRILTIVNQKLAFSRGFQPCSTFKPAVALAALSEGVITSDRTRLQVGRRRYMDLKESLAHSNNAYFARLGRLLGLQRMRKYADEFGFNEPAGWEIEEEHPGSFPSKAPPARLGGVGKVASFGEGISQTLLEEVSFMSALANGGTLYYLQYPRTPEEIENFRPRVKRHLDIGPWLEPVREGMLDAVEFGTARRARQPDLPILGKTGSCSQNGMKLGWFSGYSEHPGGIAVAVLQRTPAPMGGGPHAAAIAGRFFRKLSEEDYFVEQARATPRETSSLGANVSLDRGTVPPPGD